MRTAKVIIQVLVGLLIIAFGSAIGIVQFPSVQSRLCQRVIASVSDKIDGTVGIERIYFAPMGRLVVTGASLCGSEGDTLAVVDKVALEISPFALLSNHLKIKKIAVAGGHVDMIRGADGMLNFAKALSKFYAAPAEAATDTIGNAQQNDASAFSLDSLKFSLDKFSIDNIDFRYQDCSGHVAKKPLMRGALEWDDIFISDLHFLLSDIAYSDGSGSLTLEKLTMKEQHGQTIEVLEMAAKIDGRTLDIRNFRYKDNYSDIISPSLLLNLDGVESADDFLTKAYMDVLFDNAFLNLKSISAFVPTTKLSLEVILDGRISGSLSSFQTNGFKAHTPTGESRLEFDAHLTGLPDAANTMVNFDMKQCLTTMADIERIVNQVSLRPLKKNTIARFAPGHRFNFTGSLNGFFEDFVAFGSLASDIGTFKVDLLCKNYRFEGYQLLGFLNGTDFDLGKFFLVDELGKLSCSGSAGGFFGIKAEDTKIDIDSFSISKLEFNGYNYSRINGLGKIENGEFDGRIVSSDPNLRFMFQGIMGLGGLNDRNLFRFNLSLGYANLTALNLLKIDDDTRVVSAAADANFSRTRTGNIVGHVTVDPFTCSRGKESFSLGKMEVRSFNSNNKDIISLQSNLLEGRFEGTSGIGDFIGDLKIAAIKGKLDNILGKTDGRLSGNSYELSLKTGDLRPVCAFLAPDLHIEPGTYFNVEQSPEGIVQGYFSTGLIASANNYMKDIHLEFEADSKKDEATLSLGLLQIGSVTKGEKDTLKISAAGNSALVKLIYNGASEQDHAAINARLAFPIQKDSLNIEASLFDSHFCLDTVPWRITDADIRYRAGAVSIDSLALLSKGRSLSLNGAISSSSSDTCSLNIHNFDMGAIGSLLPEEFEIGGIIDGSAMVSGAFGKPGVFADLTAAGLNLFGSEMGTIKLLSRMDETNDHISVLVDNTLNGSRPLNLSGYYAPADKSLYAYMVADDFSLSFLSPLLSSIVTDVEGSLSGRFKAEGSLDNLQLSSTMARFNNLNAVLDYTKVPYVIDGPFSLTSEGITFNSMSITDPMGNRGAVTGGVSLKNLKQITLNTTLDVNNLLALNTTPADNDIFYGKIFATGQVNLTGPMDNILLSIDATTEPNSTISIPLKSTGTSQTSILTFVDKPKRFAGSYDSLLVKHREVAKESTSSNFDVDIRINATRNALVNLEINAATGDILSARGTGLIDLSIRDEEFGIRGDYEVDEGSYRLNLLGLVSRNFSINPGGMINFTGDIMESDLNLTAAYKTKASIAPLIADSTSTRRTVNCGIDITGKLSNPQLGFNIDIPDLDPSTQGRVETALNTEEKRMKQFLTLILSGSFIPDEQSGIFNSTTVSFFNATEIMSNQLNSIFQQLQIPLDLGFNYQPTGSGQDLFDVAVSTQLFNNRVSINGNIGNRQYSSTNQSDIVGDIDVEIKADPNGRIRVNLFSHSADEFSNYLDQTQRNGVGVAYQQDFDNFRELWQRLFRRKKKVMAPSQQ